MTLSSGTPMSFTPSKTNIAERATATSCTSLQRPAVQRTQPTSQSRLHHSLTGKTPPDFAADDFEVDFKGRGTEADLTPLGRSQLGLPPLQEKKSESAHSLAIRISVAVARDHHDGWRFQASRLIPEPKQYTWPVVMIRLT